MRRKIDTYQLAVMLIDLYENENIDLNFVDDLLHIMDLLLWNDDIKRLYLKCKNKNISYEWTVQALTWFLNDIPSY